MIFNVPFTLVKGLICVAVTLLIYKPLKQMSNLQIQVDTRALAAFWQEFLNKPIKDNNYVGIDGFWRENSYGNWKVELYAYGPYTLPGMEWEYGIDNMNGARSAKRAIRPDTVELFLVPRGFSGSVPG